MRVSSRETCIWEMPTSSPICDCVMLAKKRSMMIWRSRGGSLASSGFRDSTVLDALERRVLVAEAVRERALAVVVLGLGVQRGGGVRVADGQAVDDVLLGHARGARPSSGTVGERSSFWASSSLALVRASRSSWSRRGTRTDHDVSRKKRLISPTTVGIANVGNSTPRSSRSGRSP